MTETAVVFFPQYAPCCMGADYPAGYCLCGPAERVVRAIADGTIDEGFTAEQRAWAIADADQCGEGSLQVADLERMTDRDLARALLGAWLDYARSNCGL